jgi:predicted phosphodiesterase
MPTIRILHASDLHISAQKDKNVSPIDQLTQLGKVKLNPTTLLHFASWVTRALKAFLKKMTASSYEPDVLKRLTLFIYNNARKKKIDGREHTEQGEDKIDGVILSGDLATTGIQLDIDKVKRFLSSSIDPVHPWKNQDGEATLTAVSIPIWIVPGNHDRFEPTRQSFRFQGVPLPIFFYPGAPGFDQIANFKHTPARELGALPDWTSGPTPFRVVVLGADFSLRQFGDHDDFYGWLAQGCVYDDVLQQLIDKTEAAKSKHKEHNQGVPCILWVVHFPPGFPHLSKPHRLLFEAKFTSAANNHGIKAILAGHTHEQVKYRKPGTNFDVLCCGTTTQYVPPKTSGRNRFQIISVTCNDSSNVLITVENYKYKRAGEAGITISNFYSEP